jgi:hypothetical protein
MRGSLLGTPLANVGLRKVGAARFASAVHG